MPELLWGEKMKGRRVLNVGCGSDTYGTDFIDFSPSRKGVLRVDANEALPFDSGVFDEVYASCLFEHLHKPNDFLLEAYRVLKPGGVLVIVTDNASYITFGLSGNEHTGGHLGTVRDDLHYALYTDHHLYNHARRAGFRSNKVSYEPPLGLGDNWRNSLGLLFAFVMRHTPYWRCGYVHLRLEATR